MPTIKTENKKLLEGFGCKRLKLKTKSYWKDLCN